MCQPRSKNKQQDSMNRLGAWRRLISIFCICIVSCDASKASENLTFPLKQSLILTSVGRRVIYCMYWTLSSLRPKRFTSTKSKFFFRFCEKSSGQQNLSFGKRVCFGFSSTNVNQLPDETWDQYSSSAWEFSSHRAKYYCWQIFPLNGPIFDKFESFPSHPA